MTYRLLERDEEMNKKLENCIFWGTRRGHNNKHDDDDDEEEDEDDDDAQ